MLLQEGAGPMLIPGEAPDSRRRGLNWMVAREDDPTARTGSGKLCAFLTSHSGNNIMSGEDGAFSSLNRGLTESYSEETKEMAAISCAKGEQRLSSRSVSAARDKCLTEGCSPSCGILMVAASISGGT